MNKPKRYQSRAEISEEEISEEREKELLKAFNRTKVHGDRTVQCVGAPFEVADGEISGSGVVISSQLDQERIFDGVGSFASTGENTDRKYSASATVVDSASKKRIQAHVNQEEVLITPREKDTPFEAFRDYVLYLESKFNISLKPLL